MFAGFLGIVLVHELLNDLDSPGIVKSATVVGLAAAVFWIAFQSWRRSRSTVYFLADRLVVAPADPAAPRREIALADVRRVWHRDRAFDLHGSTAVVSFRVPRLVVEDVHQWLVEQLEDASPGCAIDER